MKKSPETKSFPNQGDSVRDQSNRENAEHKEKYLREAGKIEDLPDNEGLEKMDSLQDVTTPVDPGQEEKNEDEINRGKPNEGMNQRRNSL